MKFDMGQPSGLVDVLIVLLLYYFENMVCCVILAIVQLSCKAMQNSCRSTQIRKDRKPGSTGAAAEKILLKTNDSATET